MYKRVRKYGFTNKQFRTEYAEVNLFKLQQWVDSGRLDASQPVTMRSLVDVGLVKQSRIKHGVKLLSTVRWCTLSLY